MLTSHGVAHPALSKTIAPRQQAVHQKNENGLMGWITADLEDKHGRQELRQVLVEVLPPDQMLRDTVPSVKNEMQKDSLFGIFPGHYHCSFPAFYLGQVFVAMTGEIAFLTINVKSLKAGLEAKGITVTPKAMTDWALGIQSVTWEDEVAGVAELASQGFKVTVGKLGADHTLVTPPGYLTVMAAMAGTKPVGAMAKFLDVSKETAENLSVMTSLLHEGTTPKVIEVMLDGIALQKKGW